MFEEFKNMLSKTKQKNQFLCKQKLIIRDFNHRLYDGHLKRTFSKQVISQFKERGMLDSIHLGNSPEYMDWQHM